MYRRYNFRIIITFSLIIMVAQVSYEEGGLGPGRWVWCPQHARQDLASALSRQLLAGWLKLASCTWQSTVLNKPHSERKNRIYSHRVTEYYVLQGPYSVKLTNDTCSDNYCCLWLIYITSLLIEMKITSNLQWIKIHIKWACWRSLLYRIRPCSGT